MHPTPQPQQPTTIVLFISNQVEWYTFGLGVGDRAAPHNHHHDDHHRHPASSRLVQLCLLLWQTSNHAAARLTIIVTRMSVAVAGIVLPHSKLEQAEQSF